MRVLILFTYETFNGKDWEKIQSSRMVECDSSDDVWTRFHQVTSNLRNAVFTCYMPENRKPLF